MNNEVYHQIFLEKPEASFIADNNGVLQEVNRAFCQYFGHEPDFWINIHIKDLVQDQVALQKFLIGVKKNKCIRQKSFTFKNAKMLLQAFELSLSPVNNFFWGSLKKNDQQNLISEQLSNFKNIFNSIQSIIYYRDSQNNFVQINQRFLDVVGLPEEEVVGKNIFDVFPGQASGYLRDDIEVMVTKKPKRNIIETFRTKNGLKWFTTDKIPYYSEIGEVKGIIGFSVDITAIKNVEKALKESEEKYRAVAETTLAGMLIVDPDKRICFTNPALSRMTGYTMDELNGMPLETIFAVSNLNDCLTVSPVTERDTPIHCEKELQSKSGTINNILVSASYIRIEGYDQLCTLAVLIDITDRKRAEEKLSQQTIALQQHLSEIRQIAYVSSHDLKEPLRMITSYVQLLQKRYGDKFDKEGEEYIEYAVEGVQRMQFLLNDLLIYSEISSKTTNIHKVKCDDILTKVNENLSYLIHESQAQIKYKDLPCIEADEKLIESLFTHLIENAIKYRRSETPVIKIKAKKNKKHWQFSVQDNGIGIDMIYADRIFEIFQRLHTREKYHGNGIGLSICKKVIEKHNGNIWVDFPKSVGTTICFTLPMQTYYTKIKKLDLMEEVHA